MSKLKIYFNAIFRPENSVKWASFHNLTSSQYQGKFTQYTNEWESAQNSGLRTRNVTGYVDGNSPRYAGVWRK
ncbi:hypothetical protein VB735_13610 [Halotia wernerae UHCC 0503]|nr:hypothetical protein [Halotia wernerae UHCC 0503]